MDKRLFRIRTRSAAAAAAATLLVAVTACNSDGDAPDDPAPADQGQQQQQEETGNEQVDVTIASPAEGETVSVPFDVVADAGVELGSIDEQLHHMHVWFDDGDFLVFETDTAQITQAPEGDTTLWVQVHTYDHQPASDPVSVPVTVEGGNGAGGEGEDRNTGPYGNDY